MEFKGYYDNIIFDKNKRIPNMYEGTQGDTKSRGLYVTVSQDAKIVELTGETMRAYIEKPDEKRVLINAIKEGNAFRIDYTNQVFAAPGIAEVMLDLIGENGESLASRTFKLAIYESLLENSIVSEDERGILDKAFELAEDLIPRIELIDIELLENVQKELGLVKSELELKADKTDTDEKLSFKADKIELELKADKTDMNEKLELKADKVKVSEDLELKADKIDMNEKLGLKVDKLKLEEDLKLKADKEVVNKELDYIKSNLPVGTLPTDNHPGNTHLIKGTLENGFYGFVRPEDLGTFESGKPYNGNNLALEIGLSAGTSFNSDIALMKFSRNGKTLFIPLTGYRYSISWDAIYNAGAVYGTNDDGFLPPMGRSGEQLKIVEGNKITTTQNDFLGDKTPTTDYADTVGTVGDTLILKDWKQDKEVTILSITKNEIVVKEDLTPELGTKKSRLYNKKNVVKQDKIVTISDKKYKVRLIKGAGNNPTDSYSNADRGATGINNEWNALILPLHEHAKLGNWNYPVYAKNSKGEAIEDWGAGLTDENLRTHFDYGVGNYTWCQENRDDTTYRRVLRGYLGASVLYSSYSWYTLSSVCFRPVLESL